MQNEKECKHNLEDMLKTAKVTISFYCTECQQTITEDIIVPSRYLSDPKMMNLTNTEHSYNIKDK